jgi:hypothetical protein
VSIWVVLPGNRGLSRVFTRELEVLLSSFGEGNRASGGCKPRFSIISILGGYLSRHAGFALSSSTRKSSAAVSHVACEIPLIANFKTRRLGPCGGTRGDKEGSSDRGMPSFAHGTPLPRHANLYFALAACWRRLPITLPTLAAPGQPMPLSRQFRSAPLSYGSYAQF